MNGNSSRVKYVYFTQAVLLCLASISLQETWHEVEKRLSLYKPCMYMW